MEIAPTPINYQILSKWLMDYPNQQASERLLHGFRFGFPLNYRGPRYFRESPPLQSAVKQPDITLNKISKEISAGRMAGPFSKPPFSCLQCSPIGLVPKKTPGEYRLIHHLSFPEGESINDWIPREMCKVVYSTFDKAVQLTSQCGKGALMAKCDIKSAFRLLPVAREDFELLGFTYEGQYYFDKALPMGAAISCQLFETFATFLEFKAQQITKSSSIMHYLDDFFFVAPANSHKCKVLLNSFQTICKSLGVPLAIEKTEGPSEVITFLGLEIDSIRQLVKVPRRKLSQVVDSIQRALSAEDMSLTQVQSLIGSLNFVCRAISPGRAFLRRLIDLTKGVTLKNQRVTIGAGAKKDLTLWLQFLLHCNGVSLFLHNEMLSNFDLQLYTDAAGAIGYGAFFKGQWTQARWSEITLHHNPSIAFLELYPIVVAITLWGHQMGNHKVQFWSDNKAVVAIINKQSSHCPFIMSLVRSLVLQCMHHNILFKACHVPGVDNSIADALSRFQNDKFRRLIPSAEAEMTAPPQLKLDI